MSVSLYVNHFPSEKLYLLKTPSGERSERCKSGITERDVGAVGSVCFGFVFGGSSLSRSGTCPVAGELRAFPGWD